MPFIRLVDHFVVCNFLFMYELVPIVLALLHLTVLKTWLYFMPKIIATGTAGLDLATSQLHSS